MLLLYFEWKAKIFQETNIAYIIKVNSHSSNKDENIDKCANLFQAGFYQQLLKGKSVENSFKHALESISIANQEYEVCCCAHPHSDKCKWYKFYLEDPVAAHAMHSTSACKCNKIFL